MKIFVLIIPQVIRIHFGEWDVSEEDGVVVQTNDKMKKRKGKWQRRWYQKEKQSKKRNYSSEHRAISGLFTVTMNNDHCCVVLKKNEHSRLFSIQDFTSS